MIKNHAQISSKGNVVAAIDVINNLCADEFIK